jgi:uncharacterized protein
VRYLLDVNAILALLLEDHVHHDDVRGWFNGVEDFATCPLTQLGFARIASHERLGTGLSPENAFSLLRGLIADLRHHFVVDDLSADARILRTDLLRNSNQITDSYLLALARQHHCALATLDRRFGKAAARMS